LRVFRELIYQAMNRKILGIVFLLGLLIEVAYAVAAPLSLQYLVDDAFLQKDAKVFVVILSLLLAGGLLQVGGNIAGDYSIARFSGHLIGKLRTDLFAHLQRMSPSFYQRYKIGDLVTRFSADMQAIEGAVRNICPFLFKESLSVLLGLSLLFTIEWKLTLAVLAASVFLFVGPKLLQRRAEASSAEVKEAQERFANTIDEMTKGHKTIIGLHQQQRFRDKSRAQIAEMFNLGLRLQVIQSLMERIPLTVLLVLRLAGSWPSLRCS